MIKIKKTIIISAAFIACVALFAVSGVCRAKMVNGYSIESIHGGVMFS